MLTIARTMMTNPSLLLLDEPSEGLAPVMVAAVGEVIDAIRRQGVSILLVEQNARFALRLSSRVYVIDDGRIRFDGSVSELNADPALMSRYLGV